MSAADRKCRCGNDWFFAHQITRHTVIVSADNIYREDIGLDDAETPYGPYACTKCGAEYEELEDLRNDKGNGTDILEYLF
jgi:hypothetical protein